MAEQRASAMVVDAHGRVELATGRCGCLPVSCLEAQLFSVLGDGDPARAATLLHLCSLCVFAMAAHGGPSSSGRARASRTSLWCVRRVSRTDSLRVRVPSTRSRASCTVSVLPTSLRRSGNPRSRHALIGVAVARQDGWPGPLSGSSDSWPVSKACEQRLRVPDGFLPRAAGSRPPPRGSAAPWPPEIPG